MPGKLLPSTWQLFNTLLQPLCSCPGLLSALIHKVVLRLLTTRSQPRKVKWTDCDLRDLCISHVASASAGPSCHFLDSGSCIQDTGRMWPRGIKITLRLQMAALQAMVLNKTFILHVSWAEGKQEKSENYMKGGGGVAKDNLDEVRYSLFARQASCFEWKHLN